MKTLQNETWKQINAWLEEFIPKNSQWVKERRLEYLKTKRSELIAKIVRWIKMLYVTNLIQYIDISKELKEINKLDREIQHYETPKPLVGTTEEMIENARKFPIENLIEINARGFAICPFHNDHNPSAYCNKNYLYCFSCNEQADTIKLYMHLHNCSFKEAVAQLQ